MKGSDRCLLMAELAAAETTVSRGENRKGLEARWVSNTDEGERAETGEAGRRGVGLVCCLVIFREFI